MNTPHQPEQSTNTAVTAHELMQIIGDQQVQIVVLRTKLAQAVAVIKVIEGLRSKVDESGPKKVQ